jgi:hypothetical protein
VYNYQNHIVYLNSAKMSVSLSAVTQWQSRIIEPILVACWWWSGRSFSSCSLGVAVLDQLVDPKACLDGGLVKNSWLELLLSLAWVLFGWRPEKFAWCDLPVLLPARQADEIGRLAPPASCLAIITVQTPTSSLLLNYFTLRAGSKGVP